MKNQICAIFSFFNAAKGNWRNSIFIECGECPYDKHKPCSGFLLVPDADGQPVVLPTDVIQKMTGIAPDKDECQTILNRQTFEDIYALWLEWNVSSPNECVILQIINNACCRNAAKYPCCNFLSK